MKEKGGMGGRYKEEAKLVDIKQTGTDKKWYRKQRTQRSYMYTHGHELRRERGMLEGWGGGGIKGEKIGKTLVT